MKKYGNLCLVSISLVGLIALAVYLLPPAINVYKSVSTGKIVKIETSTGFITDPIEIQKALSGRYDEQIRFLP